MKPIRTKFSIIEYGILFFTLVGIVPLMFLGGIALSATLTAREGGFAKGHISRINYGVGFEGKKNIKEVYITFTDKEGRIREERSNFTHYNMREGDTVTVGYNSEKMAFMPGLKDMPWLFVLVFIGVPIGYFLLRSRAKKRYEKLLNFGAEEFVPYKTVTVKTTSGSKRSGPTTVYRVVLDKEYNGEYYVSQELSYDPSPMLKDKKIKLVTDPENPTVYFVDLSAVEMPGIMDVISGNVSEGFKNSPQMRAMNEYNQYVKPDASSKIIAFVIIISFIAMAVFLMVS